MRIVFNADDLGVCTGTNEGIDAAAESGLLGAVSLCVTGERVEEGARVARRHGLAVGLHFSLTLGSALTGPIAGVTDRRGRFLPVARVLAASCAGRVSRDAVRIELEAQLERAGALGLSLFHLDGHQHVHTFPAVRSAVLDVLSHHPLSYVRVPIDRGPGAHRLVPRRLVSWLSRGLVREARRRGISLPSAAFVGMGLYDAPDYRERFAQTLHDLSRRDHEWMVHPRVEDSRFAALNHVREGALRHPARELSVLRDPSTRAIIEALGFSLGARMPRDRRVEVAPPR